MANEFYSGMKGPLAIAKLNELWALNGGEVGTLVYKGNWDASSTVYPLTPSTGHYYRVSVTGVTNTITYTVNDAIVYNGSTWDKIDNTAGDVTLLGTETLFNKTLASVILGTPTSGELSNCTVDGVDAVGYRNIPQNAKSVAYTLILSDSGKHILHPSADTTARIFTIPTNASVPYPIGTSLTFVNQNGAGTITIRIATADVMRLAGAGTTGDRILAANGVATAIKITTTEWIISGTNLT